MVKKKRIEAIRSQILSKLRLPKEPEPDPTGDKEDIPTPLLSLYNSTKEMLKEQQAKVQEVSTVQEEEEYFAKVLNKFIMISEYQIITSSHALCIALIYAYTLEAHFSRHTQPQKFMSSTVSTLRNCHSSDGKLIAANSRGKAAGVYDLIWN